MHALPFRSEKKSAVGAGLSLRAGAWFSPATFYEHGPWLL